jgi:flagellum-specific peptidoglycan hydrolase FlgJ
MLQPDQIEFIKSVSVAAVGVHIWPAYAACEAADESFWGASQLCKQANNIFGTKQHVHPIFGTFNLPTKEFLSHQWTVVDAAWVKYPSLKDAFQDRMNTLQALATSYAHYSNALAAATGERYVSEVSLTWSTNPTRAGDVLAIFGAHSSLLCPATRSGGSVSV